MLINYEAGHSIRQKNILCYSQKIRHEKILSIIRNGKSDSNNLKRAKFCSENLGWFLFQFYIDSLSRFKNNNYREAEKWSYAKNQKNDTNHNASKSTKSAYIDRDKIFLVKLAHQLQDLMDFI